VTERISQGQPGDRYQAARHSQRIHEPYERSEIRESRIVEAPDLVAVALNLEPKAWVIRRHRILYEGDTPVALATSWFSGALRSYFDDEGVPSPPSTSAPTASPRAPNPTSSASRAARWPPPRIASPRHATDEEHEQLQLDEPAPILEVQHTVWDADDRPMTFEVNRVTKLATVV
jgi:GntR family transcriptional regulator